MISRFESSTLGHSEHKLDLENGHDSNRAAYIDPQKVLSHVAELRCFLDERGLFERKAFLRSFIEKIWVGDNKVTLDYTLPLHPDNTKQETVSVLDIVSLAPPKVLLQNPSAPALHLLGLGLTVKYPPRLQVL